MASWGAHYLGPLHLLFFRPLLNAKCLPKEWNLATFYQKNLGKQQENWLCWWKNTEQNWSGIVCLTSFLSGTFSFLYNQILSLAKILVSFEKKKFHIPYHSVPGELARRAAGEPGLASFFLRAACLLSCPEASAKVLGFLLHCNPSVLGDPYLILHKLRSSQLSEPWRIQKFRARFYFSS